MDCFAALAVTNSLSVIRVSKVLVSCMSDRLPVSEITNYPAIMDNPLEKQTTLDH